LVVRLAVRGGVVHKANPQMCAVAAVGRWHVESGVVGARTHGGVALSSIRSEIC